jgi:tetratricopeptide (TPR) repeat protein
MPLRNVSLVSLKRHRRPILKEIQTVPSGEATPVKTMPKRLSLIPRLTPRPIIVSMLNNKGVIYMEKRQYDEAKKSLSRALRMAEKEGNSASSIAKNSGAASQPQGGDETEGGCCPIRSDLLDASTNPFNLFSSASVEVSDNTKKPFKQRSEYDEGMDYFKDPLRLDDSSRSMDGTILFNLGRISHNLGNFDDALGFYKRSLRALERWPTSDEPLTLAILFGIGHVQYIRGDHVDALKTYMTSLSLARSAFGENSLEVAACHNCVGVLHYIMPTGNSENALEALSTSLSRRRHLLGDDHIDVGTTWNNVGRIYFQQARYEMAQEAYFAAIRIRRLNQGESVDVAATLFNIGQVYHQQDDRQKALRMYQEFLRLAKIHFGEYHRDICIVTTCMGQVLHEKKEYKKALKAFHHALRVGRVSLGAVHAEIAITLNKMGNLYYETGDLESALKAYHQGIAVELAVLEPGNANIYVSYSNVAEIHKQRSEFDKALEYYEKILGLQRKYKSEGTAIANTLSNIGKLPGWRIPVSLLLLSLF